MSPGSSDKHFAFVNLSAIALALSAIPCIIHRIGEHARGHQG